MQQHGGKSKKKQPFDTNAMMESRNKHERQQRRACHEEKLGVGGHHHHGIDGFPGIEFAATEQERSHTQQLTQQANAHHVATSSNGECASTRSSALLLPTMTEVRKPLAGDSTSRHSSPSSGLLAAEPNVPSELEHKLALLQGSQILSFQRTYHDYADSAESVTTGLPLAASSTTSFPAILFKLLEQADKEGFSDIISFQPHGRCFRVHDKDRFTKQIMPRYFKRMSHFSSFLRQLALYNFTRLSRITSPDAGGYYHPCFLRGHAHLAYTKIKRTSVKGDGMRHVANPESEPDFYAMKPVGLPSIMQQQLSTESQQHATNFSSSVPASALLTNTERKNPSALETTAQVPTGAQQEQVAPALAPLPEKAINLEPVNLPQTTTTATPLTTMTLQMVPISGLLMSPTAGAGTSYFAMAPGGPADESTACALALPPPPPLARRPPSPLRRARERDEDDETLTELDSMVRFLAEVDLSSEEADDDDDEAEQQHERSHSSWVTSVIY